MKKKTKIEPISGVDPKHIRHLKKLTAKKRKNILKGIEQIANAFGK
jgi:hypothetical protein